MVLLLLYDKVFSSQLSQLGVNLCPAQALHKRVGGWFAAFAVLAQVTAELRLQPVSPAVCPTACFHT